MFGWNTLEMICTVDGLTHPPHRLPIYLKFIGKIHIVDFCTYTCVILSVVFILRVLNLQSIQNSQKVSERNLQ